MRLLVMLGLVGGAQAQCDGTNPADDEGSNHFAAAASGCIAANETSEACTIEVSAGFEGGSIICQGDGSYLATPATACAVGTYAAVGAGTCSVCAAGSITDSGTSDCTCALPSLLGTSETVEFQEQSSSCQLRSTHRWI